jgi:hypothetical protein
MHNFLGVHFNIEIKPGSTFTKQIEVPAKSYSTLELRASNQHLSHLVFQVHSFYFNVTLSTDKILSSSHQNGTNLGFIVRPVKSTTFHLWNDNFDSVQCMVAVVSYNSSFPIPGACDVSDSPILKIEETENFVTVGTSPAKLSNDLMERRNIQCGDEGSQLEYFAYFIYLDQLNFQHEEYFRGIESMLADGATKNSHKVRKFTKLSYIFERYHKGHDTDVFHLLFV